MSEFVLKDTNRGTEKEFDTRAEAEEKKQDMVGLGASPEDLEVVNETSLVESDGGPEVVESEPVESEPTADDLPEEPPSVEEDPVDWLPGHFVDTIQGVPTVNRKGYAVIASKYGVEVTAEPVTLPSESDFEYAEFRAVAVTEDGREYSGFGSAHVDRQDGDDKHLLAELAETRAMKRATAWATGVGMTAASELMGEL